MMHGQHVILSRLNPWAQAQAAQNHHHQFASLSTTSSSSLAAVAAQQSHGPAFHSSNAPAEFAAHPRRSLPSPRAPYNNSSPTMQSIPSEEEYAHLQKLSNEFQPQVEGPLVGERQSSSAIANEYASADDVYVRKTAALPSKYSHYRTIRGDGNCGWRAIAFSYFEILQRLGDKDRIIQEITRLTSLNNLLKSVGFLEHLYEDFVDETITLLRGLAEAAPAPQDETSLLEKFNDPNISSAIIAHIRLLTSAWMKTHSEEYENFLENATIDQYCSLAIEPYQVEIENVGITALTDVLLKPAGFALEVLYLDRSVGSEVNSHRFEATDYEGNPIDSNAQTMRLLYRPGHYDILYKYGDVQQSLPQTQVAMMPYADNYHLPQHIPMAGDSGHGLAPYLGIPGMSFASVPTNGMTPLGLDSNNLMSNGYVSTPISPLSAGFPSPSLPLSPNAVDKGPGSFRPSKYEYEAEFFPSSVHSMPFQTPTFRNSHFNPAHFRNQDFQPEIWSPESDSAARSPRDENGRSMR
ncbi:MAG: hypothetical protein M4579_001743 [Chaenotheca gracillima]|nr:MAG: hypothetical protein M4579_001743 [Chaenotheca gracillima]